MVESICWHESSFNCRYVSRCCRRPSKRHFLRCRLASPQGPTYVQTQSVSTTSHTWNSRLKRLYMVVLITVYDLTLSSIELIPADANGLCGWVCTKSCSQPLASPCLLYASFSSASAFSSSRPQLVLPSRLPWSSVPPGS